MVPFSYCFVDPLRSIRSKAIERLNGVFRFIANSLEAEIVSSRKMVKYMRLDLVGSFLL